MFIWSRALKVEVSPREGALLAAAVIGLLAGFEFTTDYSLAAQVALIIVGGSFLLRWVMRLMHAKQAERRVDR